VAGYTFVVERLQDITAVDVDYAMSLRMKMDGRSDRIETDGELLRAWFERESPFKFEITWSQESSVFVIKATVSVEDQGRGWTMNFFEEKNANENIFANYAK